MFQTGCKGTQTESKKQFLLFVSGDLDCCSWGIFFCLSQAIRPADPRARHLLPGQRGGEQCVQHAHHLQEILLVINLSLQQLLQTEQLPVYDWRLADHGLIDVQDHLGRCDEDRSKSVVDQVTEEGFKKKPKKN